MVLYIQMVSYVIAIETENKRNGKTSESFLCFLVKRSKHKEHRPKERSIILHLSFYSQVLIELITLFIFNYQRNRRQKD